MIHDLLKIFVSEKLDAYMKFYDQHREFVTGTLGLQHEANMKKMKLLTFMQLAETRSQVSFGEIQKHLQINEADVEDFLIDRKFGHRSISCPILVATRVQSLSKLDAKLTA